MPQRPDPLHNSEAEALNSALFSLDRPPDMPPLNARSLAVLALLLCATTLTEAVGEQQRRQAGVLAVGTPAAATGASGPVLQRQLLDDGAHLAMVRSVRMPPGSQLCTQLSWVAADGYTHRSRDPDAAPQRSPPMRPYAPVPSVAPADDNEHERDHDDDDHPRGWSRKGAAYTAPSSASGSATDDCLGTAAGANATAAGAAVKPGERCCPSLLLHMLAVPTSVHPVT